MHRVLCALLAVPLALGTSSCCTIVSGTSQPVTIRSEPSGAEVTIDGAAAGTTPLTVRLRRRDQHLIEVAKEGAGKAVVTTTTRMNGWLWGNLLFGGILGIIIDSADGAARRIVPDTLDLQLKP